MQRGAFYCMWLFIAASWGRLSIENTTQLFRSSDGRARLFHGVNVVQKAFPWHPTLGEFDAHSSLNHVDMDNLRKWGFNAVRLGVMWPGVEPTQGVYNYTYLAVMRRIVAELDLYGISTIIDFHQDVLSQQWCGEGVPGWLHQLLANSTGGIHDKCDGIFPAVASVFGVCVPFSKYNISTDPLTGYPDVNACLANEFSKYYETPDVGSAWQAFYTSPQVLEAFVGYWRVVASTFHGAVGVIGYELINEPYPGDVWHDIALLQPGGADKQHLAPLYTALHETIRQVDQDAILLYEGVPVPDVVPPNIPFFGGIHPVGFDSGPAGRVGAEQWSNKQALSYHIYSCGFSGVGCDRNGDLPSTQCSECDAMVNDTVNFRIADVSRLGGGMFITEFGACTDSAVCVAEIERVTGRADRSFISWAYWQFKYFADVTTISGPLESFYRDDGSLQQDKLRALSRTYPPVLAGTPLTMQFDPKTSAFRLIYSCSASAATRLLPTLIYLNEDLRYGNGHDVHVINGSKLPWPLSRKNQIAVTAPLFAQSGAPVDVAVAPKYDRARVGVRWLDREPAVTWEVFDTARPGFSLLVLGKAEKELRVFDDKGDQLCLLEANGAGLKHCALDQTDWHGMLFGYRIELWFKSTLADTIQSSEFGPLINKRIAFGWV